MKRRTHDEIVQFFLDYVGGPVYRATLRALSLSCEDVIATTDQIQQFAEDYEAGKTEVFPCFSVNPL